MATDTSSPASEFEQRRATLVGEIGEVRCHVVPACVDVPLQDAMRSTYLNYSTRRIPSNARLDE